MASKAFLAFLPKRETTRFHAAYGTTASKTHAVHIHPTIIQFTQRERQYQLLLDRYHFRESMTKLSLYLKYFSAMKTCLSSRAMPHFFSSQTAVKVSLFLFLVANNLPENSNLA